MEMVLWLLAAALVLVVAIGYVWYVLGHLAKANEIVDKQALVDDAQGWWAKLNAKLFGWKTIILGWIAAGTQAVSFLLTQDFSPFKDLPWTMVFEQRVANWITFACAALIPITHALGLKAAAQIPPTE